MKLKSLPENYRTIPCKNYHGPVGCMRGEFCHFIHMIEFQGVEMPKEVFFKARNFYFAKWKMVDDEIRKLEAESKLTTEELDKLFAWI